jgi:hypothetical protein
MQKRHIDQIIFSDSKSIPITWKDIKHIKFEDDDRLNISYNEEFFSENNSWDAHFIVEVTRLSLETDEQFQKRIEREEIHNKEWRGRRYENYLKLKKEFES